MSRRLNRECPCEARGLLAPGPTSLLTDRAILASRQTQEKKKLLDQLPFTSTTLQMFLDEGLGHGPK